MSLIAALVLLAGVSTGCGGPSPAASGDGVPADAAAQETGARASVPGPGATAAGCEIDWQDPEPPAAQEMAEAVLDAPWNRDRTTRLVMSITTLVDRTTGIAGLRSDLDRRGVSLEERLDGLGAEVSDTDITIRLSGSVLFDFDSAAIRPDAGRTLAEVVEVVGAYAGSPVRVEGHTDAIASEAYNQELSEARAAAVSAWLTGHGVDAARIKTVGHGETRPVADNATAAGRQQNRRVEIVIEK